MIIRLGYEFAYEFPQPTPMVLMLGIHSSRVADILIQDNMATTPSVNIQGYWDSYGNWCNRLLAPQGGFTVSTDALIKDKGVPETISTSGKQWPVHELPGEIMLYLLASRYCETDLLNETAWDLFENEKPGMPRVLAICDFVHKHLDYDPGYARTTRTAHDSFDEGRGVCRDFTHLAIALCRCMNIPARYCTGYLADLTSPPSPSPGDFTSWVEVYIGGGWQLVDPYHNSARTGRVLVACGRDAADVSISSTFGPSELIRFSVWASEADASVIDEFEEGFLKQQFARQPCLEVQD